LSEHRSYLLELKGVLIQSDSLELAFHQFMNTLPVGRVAILLQMIFELSQLLLHDNGVKASQLNDIFLEIEVTGERIHEYF